ncbi:BTAD domain-containing putative transcriptional regulator [Streptomyces sp. NPDC006670]|uniref:AfsR/SARP family transcriptional regulator n=1 Tax=Streptomyces sp. NPDC006670 TaxID=3154476 RepID=UPI003405F5C8
MRFEVLGPVTVRTDGGSLVRVPEAKVRTLLAALLVHRRRPVAVDRLVDALWGDRPPGDPLNSLQTKVSQLRRALAEGEEGGRALVVHGPAGYTLRAPGSAVDADRFATLLARARAERSPAGRAELLTRALGLWRGDAYADVGDAGFVHAEAAGLEEQRITAHEELAEARLAGGEHARAADELAPLAQRHPLRQRLRAAQMRALYGAGRQGEALAVHAEVRERFAEELGIDPGPELAALHEAILRQDPRLAPHPPRAPHPPATRPATPARRGAVPHPAPAAGPDAAPHPAAGASRPQAPAAHPDGPSAPQPHPAAPAVAGPYAVAGRLPVPLGPLVGRAEEVARVCAAVGEGRLVTLTGPGGVGKTRLALAAAARLAAPAHPGGDGAHRDGVRFVELAGVRTGVASAVAAALGEREDIAGGGPGGRPAGEDAEEAAAARLAHLLAPRRMLLVLDNCEHVVDEAAALVSRLLREAPGVRVLATGQEPLAVAGEVLVPVAPLPGPEAAALFAERAAAAAPGFAVTPGNEEAVALICRRLDGIPLALELAATRVRALGVHALADRLHDRFRLLGQVRRDGPARQRTLRAVIDWSWGLLAAAEETVLRRLAVFSGGFTLESAEAVCAGGGIPAEDVPGLLARLVDCSLVTVAHPDGAPGGGAVRYRTLESVTAYARERLAAAGEDAALRQRHAEHFTDLAEHAAARLHEAGQRTWLERLDAERVNLAAALDHATGPGPTEAALAVRLTEALTWYWFLRGRVAEARDALTRALAATAARPDGAGGPAASLRVRRAAFEVFAGEPDPGPAAGADAPPRARWLLEFARLCCTGAATGADGAALAALPQEFRGLGDRWGEAAAHGALATRAMYRGDLAGLDRHARRAAALFTELGDLWGRLQTSEHLGVLAEIRGEHARAARLYEEGVRTAQELELWTTVSFRLARQGRIALLTGDLARARRLHERARRLAVEQSHRPAEQFAVIGLALGARRDGDPDTAEALLEPWLEWNRELRVDAGAAMVLAQLGYAAEQRGDAHRARSLHEQGREAALRTGDPRALAQAFEGIAGALAADPGGDRLRAAGLLGAAAALRESVAAPLPAAEGWDADRAVTRLRGALGAAAYEAAFQAGRADSWNQG